VQETLSQIMITRGMMPGDMGIIHWSLSSVIRNPNLSKALIDGPYRQEALVPPSPWLDAAAPAQPVFNFTPAGDSTAVTWEHPRANELFRWVVYARYGAQWQYTILPRDARSAMLPAKAGKLSLAAVAVSAVSRSGNESASLAKPADPVIVPRSAWNANAPKPYKGQKPVKITIHHEGTKFDSTKNAAQHIKNVQVWGMGKDRNWADIPYHFLIAPDGAIYEGRDVNTAGETATEYDPSGHLLITCLGNFEEQAVDARQLDALIRTIAYACRRYNIPYQTIASHRDHSQQTSCPGKNLYQYLQSGYIQEQVKALLEAEGALR
jgi:hypothetical protein